jgi:hypothetical protein
MIEQPAGRYKVFSKYDYKIWPGMWGIGLGVWSRIVKNRDMMKSLKCTKQQTKMNQPKTFFYKSSFPWERDMVNLLKSISGRSSGHLKVKPCDWSQWLCMVGETWFISTEAWVASAFRLTRVQLNRNNTVQNIVRMPHCHKYVLIKAHKAWQDKL